MPDQHLAKELGDIVWIPVRNISVVWAEAQRPFNAAHAKKIGAEFDPDLFGHLWVTLPNGQGIYHVIDGQHRKVAVEDMWGPSEQVPCRVLNAVDPARAAQLFDGMNSGRKPIQPVTRFKVRRRAGYTAEVEIDKIVRNAGYRIDSTSEEKTISCVQALKTVYTEQGGKILADVLRMISATWGMDHAAVAACIVRGYGEFLVTYGGKINQQRLKEQMAKKFTPGRLQGYAKTQRETAMGGSMSNNVARIILAQYNSGLPAARKLKESSK